MQAYFLFRASNIVDIPFDILLILENRAFVNKALIMITTNFTRSYKSQLTHLSTKNMVHGRRTWSYNIAFHVHCDHMTCGMIPQTCTHTQTHIHTYTTIYCLLNQVVAFARLCLVLVVLVWGVPIRLQSLRMRRRVWALRFSSLKTECITHSGAVILMRVLFSILIKHVHILWP